MLRSKLIDPVRDLGGTVLIVAPHMDDEVLACGGLIARLPDKERVHIVYATDGMKSPAPIFPWRDRISPDLGEIRKEESAAAVGMLGVPRQNLHFLSLPEARLRRHRRQLASLLFAHIDSLAPDFVFAPFRYDRHPDHLAINRVVTDACQRGDFRGRLMEYFVYYRWRLLPMGDIRRYVRPEYLLSVDISEVTKLKRAALDCFRTQTTQFYAWQTRPILTPVLLDEECAGSEVFLSYNDAARGAAVLAGPIWWIRIAHRLEPSLVRWKYLLKSTLLRGLGGRQPT